MTTITLPARCDRSAAGLIQPELAAAAAAGPVTIDATAAGQFGQAMLQLLVSARRSGDVTITAGEALRDAARLAGLEETLLGAAGQ
jgi:hypothetical protein